MSITEIVFHQKRQIGLFVVIVLLRAVSECQKTRSFPRVYPRLLWKIDLDKVLFFTYLGKSLKIACGKLLSS